MSQSPDPVWIGDQTETVDIEDIERFESASPFDVIPSWVKEPPTGDTDWTDLKAYKCGLCSTDCINRMGTEATHALLCRSCFVRFVEHFTIVYRSCDDPDALFESLTPQ